MTDHARSHPDGGTRPTGPTGLPALHGVRVLDLGRVLSGPFCAAVLADLGAEVIKVEPPEGDDSRLFGPFVDGDCAYFRLVNRGKRGITLDLKQEEDRRVLAGLAERSDILVENFRPGTLERLGLGDLRERNPRLIVVSISGFGHTGPLGGAAAYDLIAQAFSGLMSVTGWDAEQPTRCGVSLGDMIPGLYGALAALAALVERARTGSGQHIDLAMVDSLISILESVAMRALHSDEPIVPFGNDHAQTAPLGTYAASDAPVAIGVSNDRLFERMAAALGRPDWLADPRFMPYESRFPNREALRDEIEGELARMTAADAVALLNAAGVPAAIVQGVRQALAHPQVRARGMVATEEDGFATIASPMRLRGAVPPRRAPHLGEHNDLVAGWLAEPPRTQNGGSAPAWTFA